MKIRTAILILVGAVFLAGCATVPKDYCEVRLVYRSHYRLPKEIPYEEAGNRTSFLEGHKAGWQDVAEKTYKVYRLDSLDKPEYMSSPTEVNWDQSHLVDPYPIGFLQGQADAEEAFRELDERLRGDWLRRVQEAMDRGKM